MNSVLSLGILSLLAYFTAHLIRAIKFWFIIGDTSLSFRKVFLVFYTTSVTGFFIPLIIVEPIRLLWLNRIVSNLPRLLLAYLAHRAFDGLVVSLGFLSLYFATANQSEIVNSAVPGIMILMTACLGILGMVLTLPSILYPIQEYLIRKPNTNGWCFLLKIAGLFSRSSKLIVMRVRSNNLIIAILSLLVWLLDITAVWLISQAGQWTEVGQLWMLKSADSIFHFYSARNENTIFSNMAFPQLVICFILIVVIIISRKKHNHNGAMYGSK